MYVQAPALQVAVSDRVAVPVTEMWIVAESPLRTPQAPPIAVTLAVSSFGKVAGLPLTLVSVTTGAVVSMEIITLSLPWFAEESSCDALAV